MFKYPHKEFEKEKVKLIAKANQVLDVGGGKRFDKWLNEYKHLFDESKYKTFDYDASTKPDVVGDIHHMPIADNSLDAIICYSVLEHVDNPTQAAKELYRITKPGGCILLYVPSIYPYHARGGHYKDYWRFFDDSLRLLFESWSEVEIIKVGGYFRALSAFVPFQHKLKWLLWPLAHIMDSLMGTHRRTTTSGYIIYATK